MRKVYMSGQNKSAVLSLGKMGSALKRLSYNKTKKAGRNSSGKVTAYHRGGGSKRLLRIIDFRRDIPSIGLVERIEYDPNRSSRIALVRWVSHISRVENRVDEAQSYLFGAEKNVLAKRTSEGETPAVVSDQPEAIMQTNKAKLPPDQIDAGLLRDDTMSRTFFSYILACDKLKSGDQIVNAPSFGTTFSRIAKTSAPIGSTLRSKQPIVSERMIEAQSKVTPEIQNLGDKLYQIAGNSMPLSEIPLGSFIHNIELYPGQGGKYARSAGTYAQLVQKIENTKWTVDSHLATNRAVGTFQEKNLTGQSLVLPDLMEKKTTGNTRLSTSRPGDYEISTKSDSSLQVQITQCLVRLPSRCTLLLDSRCRATLGIVSNVSHNTEKLTKAGQSRWLGRRPIVRGVAMNPIDHPHGGGEGRTKGGRPSVTPWGKPTKGGYKRVKKKDK